MKNLKDKKNIFIGFILFQIAIITGMFAKSLHPLIVGESVLLRVEPRDPRDIFRGDYSRLNYHFNNIDLKTMPNDLDTLKEYNYGDVVYLEIEKKERFFETIGVWENKPDNGNKIIKGVVKSKYENSLNLNCGIEQYFTKSERAKELDKLSSWWSRKKYTVYVEVMVTGSGVSRIKGIHCDEVGF